MLSDFIVHPSLATKDVTMARTWYATRLGLEPFLTSPSLLAYQIEASIFTVFETPAAGTARNTVAVWRVRDLRADVARLAARGVPFEELDFGADGHTVAGIMATADPEGSPVLNAWFRDGDGNWIGMVEQVDHPGEPAVGLGIGPSLAAADLSRARSWYADKLGLEPTRVYENDELVYRIGRTHFTIYATPSAGTAKNTVAVWRVADVRSEVAALRARGVRFEDYDVGGIRTVDGIYAAPDGGELAAWFVDSEGNVIGLAEDPEGAIAPQSPRPAPNG